ncbi:dienelactone hydrolase family-domain-containing protein [Chaetomium strumarium]|uniref:Dienelactone hydrolase family-domain-containing protein n=1 Tax=Chaetomium strumarium TaxID=1170767 RepID=A0AAJ0GMT2_9PEZI|nr:dienelactone hydrolase family-domain-containing protein [Chaetomium strumarium]
MRASSSSVLTTALLLFGGAIAGCSGKPSSSSCLDASIVAHSGQPVGKEVVYNNITLYISKPDSKAARTKAREGTAVLYLTDVFGIILPENKLLADSFARAGYLTIAPDLFGGDPAPGDLNVPGFNTTEFLARHNATVTDPIIASTIAYLRTHLNVTRIAAPGYCFGGRYAFRFLAADRSRNGAAIDVGYAAHPSLLEASEIKAISGPVAIAAADGDNMFDAKARAQAEAVLVDVGQPYQVSLYSQTQHGFGVRANVSDPNQRWAKEQAFLQAVRWFDRFFMGSSSS